MNNEQQNEIDETSAAGKALSKRGAAKGGQARAAKLTAEQRKSIAREAALTRWEKSSDKIDDGILKTEFGSSDRPLRIGDIEIPAYVLEDGTRVITQRGMQTAIGMSKSGGDSGEPRIVRFVRDLSENRRAKAMLESGLVAELPDISALLNRVESPVVFHITGSPVARTGNVSYGYEATVLADLCDAVLQARSLGVLSTEHLLFAKQCEILVRSFARVGIIALVDEATGYQEFRARDALEQILQQFISEELLKWVKMFPDEFYKEIFRLRGYTYPSGSTRRPIIVAMLTNDVVYERLAPAVLDELKRVTPKDEKGRRKHKYHQRLTEEVGHDKLREHLSNVITLMKASSSWKEFRRLLDKAKPKFTDQLALAIDFVDDEAED